MLTRLVYSQDRPYQLYYPLPSALAYIPDRFWCISLIETHFNTPRLCASANIATTHAGPKFRPTWRKALEKVSLKPTLLRTHICEKSRQHKAKWSLPVVAERSHPMATFRAYSPQTVTLGVEDCELKAMTILLTNHSFVCLFTLSIFFEHLLCTWMAVTGAECTVKELPSTLQGLPLRQGRHPTRQTYSPHWMLVVMSFEEEIEQDKG